MTESKQHTEEEQSIVILLNTKLGEKVKGKTISDTSGKGEVLRWFTLQEEFGREIINMLKQVPLTRQPEETGKEWLLRNHVYHCFERAERDLENLKNIKKN